ncbi:MAG: tetratricopeptide repeat protein [Phycisphaerales bacterium]|nr:tetratricopeptide repeat protein [Phycisphaerales bacterium]
MISALEHTTWTCPNCQSASPPDEFVAGRLIRCSRCQFIYPVTHSAASADGSVAPLTDETWTDKWGPIHADRYRVIRALATGAQGKILLAHHRHLNQTCVIKLVAAGDDEWTDLANQRLRIEAQAGVRVNHPHVARVFDCDCVNRAWYFAMEYIAGENLRDVLKSAPGLDWRQAVQIGRQVSDGLTAIHRSGLIHRDVKPGNIMLMRDGKVKITDLGLVKTHPDGDTMGVTWDGQVLGTPLYMPPEQFDANATLDARADVYAFGATLFHLLTGRAPFTGKGLDDIAQKHRTAAVEWPTDVADRVPGWLRATVETCLAKRPEHRFASTDALSDALSHADSRRPLPVAPATSDRNGVVVTSFQNLSRQTVDEWIGDAIAELLSSRLMECDGLHVVDRNLFSDLVRKGAAGNGTESAAGRSQMFQAARLVGVTRIIMGSFHRQGDEIRIVAHSLSRDDGDTRCTGSVSGPIAALFELEDTLAGKIVQSLPPEWRTRRRPGAASAGTTNLDAHQQYVRGQRAFSDGDYREAIRFAQLACTSDSEYGDPSSLMGAAHARLGEYQNAVACHERQERLARERGHTSDLAAALGNLGAMYHYQGEYGVAYEFLDRASALVTDAPPSSNTAKLFGNLGMVCNRLGRCPDAERAFERSIAICKELNDLVSMVWPYNGMGSVLLEQSRFAEAREYHQRALALAGEIRDRVMVGVSQMNIGRCASAAGDVAEAEIWFNAALGTLEGTDFWNGLTLVYEHLADMYLRGDRPDDALGSIDKRIDLARRHGNRRMEAHAWSQKARAFEQLNRKDDALDALRKSIDISQQPALYDSLHRYLNEATSRTDVR